MGKPRQAGGKGVRIEEIVGGCWTRPVAADGWASPPVGRKIRWVAKTVADALREPNTH